MPSSSGYSRQYGTLREFSQSLAPAFRRKWLIRRPRPEGSKARGILPLRLMGIAPVVAMAQR